MKVDLNTAALMTFPQSSRIQANLDSAAFFHSLGEHETAAFFEMLAWMPLELVMLIAGHDELS